MITTVAVIATALVAGLVASRAVRTGDPAEDGDSPSIGDLISPLETLAVLQLAFVLVVAAQSYDNARDAAITEAGRADHLFEVAEYAPEPYRQRLQGDVVCYASAVVEQEWPAMAAGRSSGAPSVWTTRFRATFKELGAGQPEFELLVQADDERSAARRQRLTEALPAVPETVYWFMVGALAAMVGWFAFSLPRRRSRAMVITLAVVAGVVATSLLLIRDVDRAFGGVVSIEPDAMTSTLEDVRQDFATAYGSGRLPCDERGQPV